MLKSKSAIKSQKMPPRTEPLQKVHEVFNAKTSTYARRRPFYKNMSKRTMTKKLMKTPNLYRFYLESICSHIVAKNVVAKKLGGKEVIHFIKCSLLQHCRDSNNGGPKKSIQHAFQELVYPDELDPRSGLGNHLRGQRIKLQTLAADIQAMVVIRSMEDNLYQKGLVAKIDRFNKKDAIYMLHPEAEDALISLRLVRVG